MTARKVFALVLTVMLATTPLLADDVTGEDLLLCTAAEVTACGADGECVSSPPWSLNIPQFLEIDLRQKVLSTTAASGENRSTPIKNLERADGLIVIQGFEQGRAFSFVIAEETGMLTVSVARDGISVAVFGACTPVDDFAGASD